jgi:hypothetical protein
MSVFGRYTATRALCYGQQKPGRNDGEARGRMDMDWEEALLLSWGDASVQANQYRHKAARARQMAEGTTTRAVRARLLDDARRFDEIANSVDPPQQHGT